MHLVAPAFVLALAIAPTCGAADKPQILIPERLQQSMVLCIGEAIRVCPTALTDKDHGLSCVLSKRRELGHSCRAVYDQVARARKR